MTVKELIEELQKCEFQHLEVSVLVNDHTDYTYDLSFDEIYDENYYSDSRERINRGVTIRVST